MLTFLALVGCALRSDLRFCTYVSTVSMAAYMVAVLVWRPHFYPKYFQFVFGVITDIVGCLSCELVPAYLPELGVYSQFYGSAPLLTLGRWFFVVAILVWDECFGVEHAIEQAKDPSAHIYERRQSSIIVFCFNFGYCIFALLCFARVASRPAFLLGIDRFRYSDLYLSGPWTKLGGWLGHCVAIPLIAMRMGQAGLSAAGILLYVLYLLWIGNKFGAFFSLVCIAIYAFYDKIFLLGRETLVRLAISLAAVLALLVGMTTGIEVVTHGFDPARYLATRTAQQGQLWWKIYGTYGAGEGLPELEREIDEQEEGLLELKTEIGANVGSRYGIYNIMYLSTDAARVDNKLGAGSRYTQAGFPTAYYYLGVPGVLLFAVFGGFLVAILTNASIGAYISGRIPSAFILNKLMGSAATLLSMAIFYNLFTPGCWLSYFLLIFFWYIRRKDSRFTWL